MRPRVLLLLPVLLLAACSAGEGEEEDLCLNVECDSPPADECSSADSLRRYQSPGTCDPDSGECSYASQDEECAHGCSDGACLPPPDGDLELLVPEGTRLCTLWGWGGDSVHFNWEGKARVSLNAGTYVFAEGEEEIEADLIAGLEVWPGESAGPAGQGVFSHSVQVGDATDIHRYTYTQDFRLNERLMGVELRVEFAVVAGVAAQPTLTLTDEVLFDGLGYGGAYLEDWKQIPLVSCNFEALDEETVTFDVDNGDVLTLTKRGRTTVLGFEFELTKLNLQRQGQTRDVTEFFHTSSALNHHGWYTSYLGFFQEPIGNVQLVWIDQFCNGDNVFYEDAEGQAIEQSPFTVRP